MKGLADYLNDNPGKTSYASLGLGSTLHIYGEAFKRAARRRYGARALQRRRAGDDRSGRRPRAVHVQQPGVGDQFREEGRVRILAVTGEQRLPALPDVPTMAEAGFPGFEIVGWFAFFVPAKTPRPIAEKLHAALSEIIRSRNERVPQGARHAAHRHRAG